MCVHDSMCMHTLCRGSSLVSGWACLCDLCTDLQRHIDSWIRGSARVFNSRAYTHRQCIVDYANEQVGLTFSACSSCFHLGNKEQWPISKPLKHILGSVDQLCLGYLLALSVSASTLHLPPLFFSFPFGLSVCLFALSLPVDPDSELPAFETGWT